MISTPLLGTKLFLNYHSPVNQNIEAGQSRGDGRGTRQVPWR